MSETDQTPEEDIVTREYECAYLLVPSIANEQVATEAAQVKQVLTDHGAEVANEQEPRRIPLAYTMSVSREGTHDRYTEGLFGWITFEARSTDVPTMKEALRENGNLIRYMIIKADKDQKPAPSEEELAAGEDENGEQASEEEIEESIDELVTEDEQKTS